MIRSLKSRLQRKPILLAPGVSDSFTAMLAFQAGAEALYVSGAAMAYTRLGRPDIGLMTMTEVAETISLIRDRVPLPLIVDADDGYGNSLNMQRTMRMFERAGADAIQIEDQCYPKRCGHFSQKRLVPPAQMVGKLRAAIDARHSQDVVVIARTDAIEAEGFDAAIDRANQYAEAGADILFVEAPRSSEQLSTIVAALGGRAPLMANMVEGGKTPMLSANELETLGFSLVIFPAGVVRASAHAVQRFYQTLLRDGTSASFQSNMLDLQGLNDVIGTSEMLAMGKTYDC
jgi:2-methylisocitrate lyase-like PEP mutase family enzyme